MATADPVNPATLSAVEKNLIMQQQQTIAAMQPAMIAPPITKSPVATKPNWGNSQTQQNAVQPKPISVCINDGTHMNVVVIPASLSKAATATVNQLGQQGMHSNVGVDAVLNALFVNVSPNMAGGKANRVVASLLNEFKGSTLIRDAGANPEFTIVTNKAETFGNDAGATATETPEPTANTEQSEAVTTPKPQMN